MTTAAHAPIEQRTWAEVAALIAADRLGEECFPTVVIGRCGESGPPLAPGSAPCIVIGRHDADAGRGVDVVAENDDDLSAILDTIERCPLAATALAVLLRGQVHRSIDDGLAAESAVYSTLQAGPEFATWRATHAARPVVDASPTVISARSGPSLDVTLNRPHRHNAVNRLLRDELVEALGVALVDDTITEVALRGAGASFCSGGDLDEFGELPDPATAHAVRLTRSPARAIALIGDRTTAYLHGACVGAGIEWAAFSARVVAAPDARIALPEVGFGLVPGAGGTVSLPRRIGRHRTAWLALTRRTIDARSARSWGLVDEVR
ncbi:MAG TPA: enoyl-CoA hydratase/isomerase family protein [Ilumatobacteraceae bacterium]